MKNQNTVNGLNVRKKLLATAVASYALLGAAGVMAQEGTDEIVITGIKASLQNAMNIKREATGVVDAISSEDMGKMPDTNLSESLQRITGVSIDRSNNEGSKVTVRGFGPDFNLITLNGRQMPTQGSNRSFEFSDVAADGISGVEVYKTFSATRATGGIGALINIKTARPLDKPGLRGAVTAKASTDTTNVTGKNVTPDISGIFSDTFADDTFGVSLSGSYQERDSRGVTAAIDSWRNDIDFNHAATVVDGRADKSGHIFYPRNFGYGIEDISRDRTNGQLVLQYAPTETLKTTLDYTYGKTNVTGLNDGVGIWYNDGGSDARDLVIDKNGTVRKLTAAGDDFASNERMNTSETENKSLGFNVEWKASDNLTLGFDTHKSDSVNQGVGRGNDAFLILAAASIDKKTYDSTSGKDIPFMNVTFNPAGPGIGADGFPTAASYDSLFGQAGININKSEVTQNQFSGKFDTNEDKGITSIDFGLGNAKIANRWRSYNTNQLPAGWYGGNANLFPDDIFTAHKLNGLTSSFSGGGSNVPFYHSWDFEKAVGVLENGKWKTPQDYAWGSGPSACNPCVMRPDLKADPVSDHKVTEETTSAYFQVSAKGEVADKELNVTSGLRYERTDITANSFQIDPTELVWISSTEWSRNLASKSTYTDEKGKYSVWLPSFDASLKLTDSLVSRVSYSKSITRPGLGDMIGTFSVTSRPKPGERTGNAGNPDLKPFSSDNFDISTEWYYADTSYVSAGFFVKNVHDFIVTKIVDRTVGNLRDPSAGARARTAQAELAAEGKNTDATNIINRIKADTGLGATDPIVQKDSDPLAIFKISQPINEKDAQFYGFELAVQHMFGESGFGLQANMTTVKSDINIDNSLVDFQFSLPGLSDSANLVAFYDKNGIQARVAYNWRDTFLNGIGAGNAPQYTKAYGQLDASLSYELPWVDGMTVMLEGTNLLDSSQQTYSRFETQFKSASQYGARYNLGVRYKF